MFTANNCCFKYLNAGYLIVVHVASTYVYIKSSRNFVTYTKSKFKRNKFAGMALGIEDCRFRYNYLQIVHEEERCTLKPLSELCILILLPFLGLIINDYIIHTIRDYDQPFIRNNEPLLGAIICEKGRCGLHLFFRMLWAIGFIDHSTLFITVRYTHDVFLHGNLCLMTVWIDQRILQYMRPYNANPFPENSSFYITLAFGLPLTILKWTYRAQYLENWVEFYNVVCLGILAVHVFIACGLQLYYNVPGFSIFELALPTTYIFSWILALLQNWAIDVEEDFYYIVTFGPELVTVMRLFIFYFLHEDINEDMNLKFAQTFDFFKLCFRCISSIRMP